MLTAKGIRERTEVCLQDRIESYIRNRINDEAYKGHFEADLLFYKDELEYAVKILEQNGYTVKSIRRNILQCIFNPGTRRYKVNWK